MKVMIVEKGKERQIEVSDAEYAAWVAACSTGDEHQGGYRTWFEFYASHAQAKAIVEQELKGTTYLLRDDSFTRNGLEVHRVYLTSPDQLVRLASKYFDAWNHCQRCGSFDVSIYHRWSTVVFCNRCQIHRKYRPHASGGIDVGPSSEPDLYELALNPRLITYEDTMREYPPRPKVIGRYDLWRHRQTHVLYRPIDNQAVWRDGKALFRRERIEGARTRYVWLKQNDLDWWAVNQPIYGE